MAEIQAQLQSLSEEFTALQQELQTVVQSRQKLEAQKQENTNVQKEFQNLKDGENIYKLVGPVLLKQDKVEAESTVNGRLEFISKELERTESHIKDVQEKIEKKKGEIIQAQASLQAGSGGPAQVAAQG
ncbi:Prefoldin beta-like protein [Durotheca rogersii]|uniref:Prefoldin beta-like protein n=1 Tax=Durotheca rogersii TaxID=419775 RepID=UPI002220B1C9|nr:Prefoldin beta-like protein [Durotheca rogersii]KAI5859854.1 Prefoldin beta-like protein [Durotheca rogersii]